MTWKGKASAWERRRRRRKEKGGGEVGVLEEG